MDTGQVGVDRPELRAPDPARFSDPFEWIKATRRAGFKVDHLLRGSLSRLMETNGWDVADSFAWLEAEGHLHLVDHSFRLRTGISAQIERHEYETRLPAARYEIDGDNAHIHFPEAGDLRPFYGYVYSQQGDGSLEPIGVAEGKLTVPTGQRLTFQSFEPGKYGHPFRDLPPDLFDQIVTSQMGWKVTDDDMDAFSDLYETRSVSIGYTYEKGLIFGHGTPHKVSDDGMRYLARFDRLEELGMKSKLVTDEGLAVLADKRSLRSLKLCYAKVTPVRMATLPIDELTTLTLEWVSTIGTDLSFLRRCPKLEHLGLRIAAVNDSQLPHVGALEQLTTLDLAHNSPSERFDQTEAITDEGVAHLRNLPHLETLYLAGTKVTDRTAEHLRTLPKLTKLSIGQSALTDRFVEGISSMTQLEDLSLYDTDITNKAFNHLAELPNLRVLRLGKTKVDGAGLDQLVRISSLEHIELMDTNVTAEELGKLSVLPHLKELEVWYLTDSQTLQDRVQAELPGVRVMFEH